MAFLYKERFTCSSGLYLNSAFVKIDASKSFDAYHNNGHLCIAKYVSQIDRKSNNEIKYKYLWFIGHRLSQSIIAFPFNRKKDAELYVNCINSIINEDSIAWFSPDENVMAEELSLSDNLLKVDKLYGSKRNR